jgi:transcription initiation factor TFIIIB Brf1 subunit/transcription initiation factor TFIIB
MFCSQCNEETFFIQDQQAGNSVCENCGLIQEGK